MQRALATPKSTWDFFGPSPELDLTPVLPKVEAPTLVMCGERDLRVPLDISRKIAESIPNAWLYVFREQGQLPAWTAPDEFFQVLRSFVLGKDIGQLPDGAGAAASRSR